MGALKEVARSILMAPRKKEYEARLSYLSNTYDAYMLEQEKELMDKMKKGEASTLTSLEFVLEEGMKTGDADILIFIGKDAVLSPTAKWEICKAFEENPDGILLYCDEDSVICSQNLGQLLLNQFRVGIRGNIAGVQILLGDMG